MKWFLGLLLVIVTLQPVSFTNGQASKPSPGLLVHAAATVTVAQADQGTPGVKVWVNTASGVYHSGTRWYGNTKQGEFMSQAEAQKKGCRPAYGKALSIGHLERTLVLLS